MHCHGKEIAPWMPYFAGFTEFTSTIPKLYWNVESQEQRILTLCKQLHKLICYIDCVAEHVNIDHNEIEKLKAQFQKFMESGFDDYYFEQIEKWINKHMPEMISKSIKQVYFGLTEDGHFVAYVPGSWSDIQFDTGAIYGRSDYGRLKLRFEADGAIDNRYTYNVSQLTENEQFVNDFEALNNVVSQWRNELAALETRIENLEG